MPFLKELGSIECGSIRTTAPNLKVIEGSGIFSPVTADTDARVSILGAFFPEEKDPRRNTPVLEKV
jgi:hypothetical protein